MFRRKEDSLFDTDPNEVQEAGATQGATAATGATQSTTASSSQSYGASSATPTSASQPASSASVSSSTTSGAPAPRPMPETRATGGAPTASAFRSSAQPLSNDMTRNRMPESKSPATPAAPITASAVSAAIDKAQKGGLRVLTVGNDILLKGEIATCDRLVIEGKVDATLNDVHTVEIAVNGSFKGSANIEDAEISGLFEGDLVVRNRLVIYATGKVRGKITYGEIEIERGGELTGEIKNSEVSAPVRGTRSHREKEDNKYAA